MATLADPRLKRWTSDEVQRLVEAGIVENPKQYELLNGQIWEKWSDGLKPWTVRETHAMYEAGVIENPQRYELLDGQIWEKMGQNAPHRHSVIMAIRALTACFGEFATVISGLPITIDELAEPEPDVAVLPRDSSTAPTGRDVWLAVEVSDTSRSKDFGVKARLYARGGVAEYWIVDINRRQLVVHRHPLHEAAEWRDVTSLSEDAEVTPPSPAKGRILVRDLLPLVGE